jgi:hypothetical protein
VWHLAGISVLGPDRRLLTFFYRVRFARIFQVWLLPVAVPIVMVSGRSVSRPIIAGPSFVNRAIHVLHTHLRTGGLSNRLIPASMLVSKTSNRRSSAITNSRRLPDGHESLPNANRDSGFGLC